ncbi:DNA-binding NarL/FixJ family response regulator [Kitasatospora sp. MAP12-15]|uniref:response regulator transcription factor n=1 Tax=unclassified Kitasatospora TaxID=2633591 RepID=UPI0024738587|nr:response regulator transcription factor [Kitasatospora sp. MAP12-44]MDH6111408.1 DNA-binding NarL/FixJ family response regulator [Kitasatospora sp. MAP12-44]
MIGQTAQAPPLPPRRSGARRKIAVVFQQQLIGASLAATLKLRGHAVTTAALADAATVPAGTDLVLVAVENAISGAVRALRRAAAAAPRARCLVVGPDDAQTAVAVLQAGAHGYVIKGAGMDALERAIGLVLTGQIAIDPDLLQRALAPAVPTSDQTERLRLLQALTPREREALTYLCEGLSSHQISQRLGIETSTARTHVQRVLTKLGASTRLEATTVAARYHLTEPSDLGVSSA